MKLTEADCFAHDVGLLIKCNNWEQLEQQILGDYEKARKWDALKPEARGMIKAFNWLQENEISKIPDHPKNIENQKLRELIEERIKSGDDLCEHLFSQGESPSTLENEVKALRQLLEESKK